MRERNQMIDNLKGFAIVLVVLGHVIQTIYAPDRYDANLAFKIIYSFHMPLFIFISGYLSGYKERLDFNWIRGRFLRLGIPFWLWVLLDSIICGKWSCEELKSSYLRVFYDPSDQGLWFLWVLFLCCVFLGVSTNIVEYVMKKLHKFRFQTIGAWIIEISMILLLLISLGAVWSLTGFTTILGLRLFCKEIVFFLAGYYIRKYKNTFSGHFRSGIFFYVLYPICVCMWDRTHFVIFYDDMMKLAGSNIILKICALGFAAVYFYFVSFLGIGFVWKIFEYINNRFKLHILSQVGMYTMEIYILHRYFFINLYGQRWLNSILSLFFGIVIPIFIGKIFARCKVLSKVLFGN